MKKEGQIHTVDFIKAMSSALELSSEGISMHHQRTSIIAAHIAEELKLKKEQKQILIFAAMLHDIGAASNWDEKHFITHSDNEPKIYNHAEAGYQLLKDSPQLGILAETIRYHHDRCCGGNPSGLSGKQIPLLSRILHIADRIEVQIDKTQHIFPQRDRIIASISKNDFYDADIIEVVKKLSKTESFWLDIVNQIYMDEFMQNLNFFGKDSFEISDIIVIAEIFSKVIDATSHYTATHSKNVANVSRSLSLEVGFSIEEANHMYLAGLLHDIGKLAVPNEILDKPGKLDHYEYEIVKQHPYYSYIILNQVEGFSKIAKWAGGHHEYLNGNGYPFRLDKANIEHGTRILSVADVFCALVEERPYRIGMNMEQANEIMSEMVEEGKLDGRIIEVLKQNGKESYLLIEKNF